MKTTPSKYIDLKESAFQHVYFSEEADDDSPVRSTLEWLDANPDVVPKPKLTITESEFEVGMVKAGVSTNDGARAAVKSQLGCFDITVVPDPVQTEAQRLESLLIEKWGDADDARHITRAILSEFDVSVKAPEVTP